MLAAAGGFSTAAGAPPGFIPALVNSSTIPANGDVNPYGVAFVPDGFPSDATLAPGDVLASNFNNSANVQGTGTTIVMLRPSGSIAPPNSAAVFFTSALPGLSTALGVLRGGFVLVGNVPTTDGSFSTIGQGALQVINRDGTWLQTWTDAKYLDGPSDLALDDQGQTAHIFVSNVLNGTVSRLDVRVDSTGVKLLHKVTVAKGYTVEPNMAAVVLGPTGLAFDAASGVLYVASTADNAIYSIEKASTASTAVDRGTLVFSNSHLRGPLALRLAPNGDLLTANGDAVNADLLHPSEIVEFTTSGHFVREYDVDASQGGAFGLDVVQQSSWLDAASSSGSASDDDRAPRYNYAVIDDVTNNLSVFALPAHPHW